jgi:hypothetical protein
MTVAVLAALQARVAKNSTDARLPGFTVALPTGREYALRNVRKGVKPECSTIL